MSRVIARATIVEMTMVRINVISMVVNIAIERNDRKHSIRKVMGAEMGATQQPNGVGKGRGEGWGEDKGE